MIAVLLACGAPTPPAEPRPPPPDVVARYQCDRCHDGGDTFAAAEPDHSCVGCHQMILAGAYDGRFLAEDTDRWKSHLHRILVVPSLVDLDRRWTRAGFLAYLAAPTDLRPALPATMPPLPVTPEDAAALADQLGLQDPAPGPISGDVDRGLAIVAERCAACHGVVPLAPDLATVAARSWPAAVDSWLADPAAVKADTTMPAPGLTPDQRADVVAALFSGRLARVAPPTPPPAAPSVTRPVTYAEVDREVFHEVCRHCHADPLPVGGDGGPGNTGGFGFAGAGLDLSSRGSLVRGGRHDVLERLPDGTPRLVAHLEARHHEVAGQPVPGVLGMPLGLPPLPPDRIALVRAWIEQGAPE